MPRFSKRANLLKDLEAVANSHTIKLICTFTLMQKTALKMILIII